MNRFLIALFMFALVASELMGQQVPQFSQYMFNPVFINPAYAGYKEQLYVHAYYRKQWSDVEGSPETMAISADGYLPNSNLGIGLMGISDKIGAQRTNAIYGNLSYRLRLRENNYLNFGTAIGVRGSMLDGSLLNPGGIGTDPLVPAGKNNATDFDFKLGVFYYTDKFYLGAAFDNLASPIFNPDKGDILIDSKTHLNLTAGTLIEINPVLAIKPSMMVLDDFHAPARVDFNTVFIFNGKLWLGGSYRTSVDYAGRVINPNLRHGTALVLLLEFFATENLHIGYAYDHQINGFNPRNFSSHDISLGYLFPSKRIRSISPRNF